MHTPSSCSGVSQMRTPLDVCKTPFARITALNRLVHTTCTTILLHTNCYTPTHELLHHYTALLLHYYTTIRTYSYTPIPLHYSTNLLLYNSAILLLDNYNWRARLALGDGKARCSLLTGILHYHTTILLSPLYLEIGPTCTWTGSSTRQPQPRG